MSLTEKKCVPCEGDAQPLNLQQISQLLPQLNDWELQEDRILKNFEFDSFKQAISFVNKVAEIAEQENHHPDIEIHYSIVRITLWTHAIKGLSENDFILAAKIDKIKVDDAIFV